MAQPSSEHCQHMSLLLALKFSISMCWRAACLFSAGVAGLQCGPDKVEWRSMRASGAEGALRGKALTVDALVAAMEELQHDISPGNTPGRCLLWSAAPSPMLQQHVQEQGSLCKIDEPTDVQMDADSSGTKTCCGQLTRCWQLTALGF